MNLFQSPEWEQFKLATGYQKSYRIDDILVLQKNLPFGRSMLYSPRIVDQTLVCSDHQSHKPQAEAWATGEGKQFCKKPVINQKFISKIKNIGQENKSIFYRAEFDTPLIPDTEYLIRSGFVKSFEEMQPEHTLILDIIKSEQDILAAMKPKGRYNIKIAEKNNIQIRKSRQVDDFYRLYEETAKRQKITYRSKQYFSALLDNLEPKGYCELFIAYGDKSQINSESESNEAPRQDSGQAIQPLNKTRGRQCNNEIVLAAAIISFYKGRATYLFGASSSEMRNLMAPYKLHWQIIQEAKRRGFTEYDFFGIAPTDDPKHPWAGVSRFKKQFGGQEVHLAGSFDLILRPTEYKIFKLAEKIRRR